MLKPVQINARYETCSSTHYVSYCRLKHHCYRVPTKDVGSPRATRKEKKSYVSKWRNLIKTTALPQEPQSQKQAKVHAERQMGRKRETDRM